MRSKGRLWQPESHSGESGSTSTASGSRPRTYCRFRTSPRAGPSRRSPQQGRRRLEPPSRRPTRSNQRCERPRSSSAPSGVKRSLTDSVSARKRLRRVSSAKLGNRFRRLAARSDRRPSASTEQPRKRATSSARASIARDRRRVTRVASDRQARADRCRPLYHALQLSPGDNGVTGRARDRGR